VKVAHRGRKPLGGAELRGIRVELVRDERPILLDDRAGERRLESRQHDRRVDDQLGDLVPHVRDPRGAIGLRDELGEPDEPIGRVRHVSGAACSQPDADRVHEQRGIRGPAVEQDALGRREDVEDDRARRQSLLSTEWRVALIAARAVGGGRWC
jgi:hypothetical protein